MTTGRLSKAGAGAGAAHEALYLFAYPDPGTGRDPWTIGLGHTDAAGPPIVRRGDRITIPRGFEMYATDMGKVEVRVRRAIKRELKQHEFDAACIFDLNTGAISSGSIDDRMNAGDINGALAVWSKYINAGGKPMKGLITRRAEEIELFRTGRYPSRKILIKDTPTGSGRYIAANAIPWRDEPASVMGVPVVIDADRPAPIVVKSPVKGPESKPIVAVVTAPRVPVVPPPAPTVWQRFAKWFAEPNYHGA